MSIGSGISAFPRTHFLSRAYTVINGCKGGITLITFKKPLSARDEEAYIRQAAAGDMQARRKLIEHNMRLVAHIARKYTATAREPDDLISIGAVGLIKAIDTYNYKKGSRLATYAARCIENEILMQLRSDKKRSREVSLFEPIGTDREGNEINLCDIMETNGRDTLEVLITNQNLKKLGPAFSSCLKKREQQVLCMRYGLCGYEEYTQREIAQQMQVSRSYISRIEKAALLKLREELEK